MNESVKLVTWRRFVPLAGCSNRVAAHLEELEVVSDVSAVKEKNQHFQAYSTSAHGKSPQSEIQL